MTVMIMYTSFEASVNYKHLRSKNKQLHWGGVKRGGFKSIENRFAFNPTMAFSGSFTNNFTGTNNVENDIEIGITDEFY